MKSIILLLLVIASFTNTFCQTTSSFNGAYSAQDVFEFTSFYNKLLTKNENYTNIIEKETIKNSNVDSIFIEQSLAYMQASPMMMIVKYHEVKNKVSVNSKSLVFIKSAGTWQSQANAYKEIRYVVEHLKTESLWDLYSSNPRTNNILQDMKKAVKNAQGIIDITKLAVFMEQNKNKLIDICDF